MLVLSVKREKVSTIFFFTNRFMFQAQGNHLFSFWLNPTFVYIFNNNVICLKKQDIDLAFRDKACKDFSEDFSVGITFKKE